MSRAARSLFAFGIYGVVAGLAIIAVPSRFLSATHLPTSPEGWMRVVGILAMVVGTYDISIARAECLPLIRASVLVRFGFAAGAVVLFVTGQMPASAVLLGAVDVSGATWTILALKRDGVPVV